MAGKFEVTIRDKKKALATCKIFGGLSVFFTITSVLSLIFTPRSDVVKGIDNQEEKIIKTFCSIDNGEKYVVASPRSLQTYYLENNQVDQTIAHANEISALMETNNEDYDISSLSDPNMHYFYESDNEGYLLIFDNDGDIFRYDYHNDKFSLNNDYFLTDRITINDILYKEKFKIRSFDVLDDVLYALYERDNSFVVNTYDINNLKGGIKASKQLYLLKEPDKDQKVTYGKSVYIVDPIDSKDGENPYGINVIRKNETENYLFVFTSLGLIRWNTDFKDYNDESFFNDPQNYFLDALKADILALDDSRLENINITREYVQNASSFIIEQIYKSLFSSSEYVQKESQCAREYKDAHDYVKSYDPSLKSETLVIKNDHVQADKNISIKVNGEQTVGGFAFNPNNEHMYYLDFKSAYIFEADTRDTFDYEIKDDRTLSDIATKSDACYKGYTFTSIKGNLGYDEVSNNIHITFYSSRKISIVGLDRNKPYIKDTFNFEYDIRGFVENKEGSRIAAMYQTEKRNIKNVASFPLHVGLINPAKYRNRGIFVTFFIVSIALLAVSGITLFISLRAYSNAKALLKCKVIGRDFKRNKWTYVALIPFIALLIMFCYIEAVGSISFSFFSYTQQKPSYIWNTFGNYIEIFNDKDFWLMFGNTMFFLVFDLFFGIIPPIFFAFCLSIIKSKKLSGVLRALMFIPAIVPGIATLLIWKVGIFGDSGILNQIVCLFKTGHTYSDSYVPVAFLHDEKISRWSLLLMGFPYVGGYLIFYGGIMNIPKEYDEACQLEGLGVIKRFLSIDIPLIKPQIKYIFVMGILGSVQNYERTYMLGSSGTRTFVESMYRQMKDVANPNYGLASAYATLIFIMLLFPVLWNFRKTKKDTLGDML